MSNQNRAICALVVIAFAGLMCSCSDDSPSSPRPGLEPLLRLSVGTWWVYADSVFAGDSVASQIDTVIVMDSVRDSLGLQWVLSKDIPWLHNRIVQKADTICSVEMKIGGQYLARQFWPPQDTAYDYSVVVGDFVRALEVQRIDSAVHTPAGAFDQCILYTNVVPAYEVRTYILARGIGFLYADIVPDTSRAEPRVTRRTRLIACRLNRP